MMDKLQVQNCFLNIFIGTILLGYFFFIGNVHSEDVINVLGNEQVSFNTKIKSAMQYALKHYNGRKIWIIYSIPSSVRNQEDSYNRKYDYQNCRTLEQILFQSSKQKATDIVNKSTLFKNKGLNFKTNESSCSSSFDASDVAIILDCSLESFRPCIYQADNQQLGDVFSRENRPIIWLGHTQSKQSYQYLKALFYQTKYEKLRGQLIGILAIHSSPREFYKFSVRLINGSYTESLKSKAIYWLGQYESLQNVKLLATIAVKAHNVNMKKKAIHALGEMQSDPAKHILRYLAQKLGNPVVRKEAIFWLGQMSDNKSIHTLLEIILGDSHPDIKEYAIFALSQMPDEKGKRYLMKIVRSDLQLHLREKAVFWLSHSEESKQIDFMLDIMDKLNN